jgi:hypothetical protein
MPGDSRQHVGVGDRVVRVYKRWRTVGVVEEVRGTSRPSLRVRFPGQDAVDTFRGYGSRLGDRESDLASRTPAAYLVYHDEPSEREWARQVEAKRQRDATGRRWRPRCCRSSSTIGTTPRR